MRKAPRLQESSTPAFFRAALCAVLATACAHRPARVAIDPGIYDRYSSVFGSRGKEEGEGPRLRAIQIIQERHDGTRHYDCLPRPECAELSQDEVTDEALRRCLDPAQCEEVGK